MRLQLFNIIDDTIALKEKREDYYQESAYELQNFVKQTLSSDTLLGVNARVKSNKSLREKIVRKKLYMLYDNHYDMLTNLSDLIGLRAECRFLREEHELFDILREKCTLCHADGSLSVPDYPNIRLELSSPQPQTQKNGLEIYRIDGKYHKNGVTSPFELQIKCLANIFWAEIEHELIYKNNSYIMNDDFLKQLLYANYESLRQMDANLQLLYDHMQYDEYVVSPNRSGNIQPIIAKTLSDLFVSRMNVRLGFSLSLNSVCDILAEYLFSRCVNSENPINELVESIRLAAIDELDFEEAIELEGAYSSDDEFHNAIGTYIAQQVNLCYEWNMFFRMLFALEKTKKLISFNNFVEYYCSRFTNEALYKRAHNANMKDKILSSLADVLINSDDISILYECNIKLIENEILLICADSEDNKNAATRFKNVL